MQYKTIQRETYARMVILIPRSFASSSHSGFRYDVGITRLGFGGFDVGRVDVASSSTTGRVGAVALVPDRAFAYDSTVCVSVVVAGYIACTTTACGMNVF